MAGTPGYAACAGSGGGGVNPEFVRRCCGGDRSAGDANSPRKVMNTCYCKPPCRVSPERADVCAGAILAERSGAGC